MTNTLEAPAVAPGARPARGRRAVRRSSLWAHGEPFVWLAGGAMAVCLLMIAGLLAFVFAQGFSTFWPQRLVQLETADGRRLLGEVAASETFRPGERAFEVLPAGARESASTAVAGAGGESSR